MYGAIKNALTIRKFFIRGYDLMDAFLRHPVALGKYDL